MNILLNLHCTLLDIIEHLSRWLFLQKTLTLEPWQLLHQVFFALIALYTKIVLHQKPFHYTRYLVHHNPLAPNIHRIPFTTEVSYNAEQSLEQTDTFTSKSSCTRYLLYHKPFTPRAVYTRYLLQQIATNSFDTRHLLRRMPFTPEYFYTKNLLLQKIFVPES